MLTATGTATVIGGVMIQFIAGSFLPWRTVAAISAIIPACAFIGVFFIPESPYWLYSRDHVDEAHRSLQWLRGWVNFSTVEEEFKTIVVAIERTKNEKKAMEAATQNWTNKLMPFGKRSFLQPFTLIIGSFFIGHFSGMTPLQTYAIKIFNAFETPINEYYATILLGLAQFLGCIIGAIFIRKTGKRRLVFVSLIGNGLCFFATATYVKFCTNIGMPEINLDGTAEYAIPPEDEQHWLPMILLLLGSLSAHIGIKMVPWMLIGEVI